MRGIRVRDAGWIKLAAALLAALAMGYASSRVWGAERQHYAREYKMPQEQAERAVVVQLRGLADKLERGDIRLLGSDLHVEDWRGRYSLEFEVRH